MVVKDRMHLYRHAARCPCAIQIFLNFNPVYERFVPLPVDQSVQQNLNSSLPSTLVVLDPTLLTGIGPKDCKAIPETAETRSDEAT